LGAVDFIEKPFAVIPFLARLMGYLRSQQNVAAAPPQDLPFLPV